MPEECEDQTYINDLKGEPKNGQPVLDKRQILDVVVVFKLVVPVIVILFASLLTSSDQVFLQTVHQMGHLEDVEPFKYSIDLNEKDQPEIGVQHPQDSVDRKPEDEISSKVAIQVILGDFKKVYD